ncbi:glutamate racemase [Porphyromonas cangingivalis]|uniref:Glutamate racemase n=2 Tax=Porphyromonas cangingivalis TaxID=36874 RepID=A0A1T4KRY8_PORCN|nr:glutamate racemase [Porphyromonas cangingivalis]SJZ45204.1 glutamate racemase [Porphyromonas cangingivalis]VEJ02421.1 Glutamate racemase 1 [Porphyromonas cangingivalis]
MVDREMGAIGVFDSGFGGLTVLRELRRVLPDYDFIYLGDNARAPYGSHSFDTIYRYTREAVSYLFDQGCPLVILACNTASAKALRSLQQIDLPISKDPTRRILGVIRPTVESVAEFSRNGHIGIVGTNGTISSNSYSIEIAHLYPEAKVSQLACPMWVPLVENNEIDDNPGTQYFIRRDISRLLSKDQDIDTILLGCTHYPLLLARIREALPREISLVSQGAIVASSLQDYLHRHPEMDIRLSKTSQMSYRTTSGKDEFLSLASVFLGEDISSDSVIQIVLPHCDRL